MLKTRPQFADEKRPQLLADLVSTIVGPTFSPQANRSHVYSYIAFCLCTCTMGFNHKCAPLHMPFSQYIYIYDSALAHTFIRCRPERKDGRRPRLFGIPLRTTFGKVSHNSCGHPSELAVRSHRITACTRGVRSAGSVCVSSSVAQPG